MSELTQEQFDRERERFIGTMVGQDAAEVWKGQATKLAARCDEQDAEIKRLRETLSEIIRKGTWTGTDGLTYTSKECRIASAGLGNQQTGDQT